MTEKGGNPCEKGSYRPVEAGCGRSREITRVGPFVNCCEIFNVGEG